MKNVQNHRRNQTLALAAANHTTNANAPSSKLHRFLVSFRGATGPGGMAAGMRQAYNADPDGKWLHWGGEHGNNIVKVHQHQPHTVGTAPADVVKHGYRGCNAGPWLYLHELEDERNVHPEDLEAYLSMNDALGRSVAAEMGGVPGWLFNHDYQSARVPLIVRELNPEAISTHVVHTPYVKRSTVPESGRKFMDTITEGALGADFVVFHTRKWLNAFCDYVEEGVEAGALGAVQVIRHMAPFPTIVHPCGRTTELVVHHLPIDTKEWAELSVGPLELPGLPENIPTVNCEPFFLAEGMQFFVSFERGDKSKAIARRFRSIARYFQKYPERIGKVTFIQITEKTRLGVKWAADEWEELEKAAAELFAIPGLQRKDWLPLVWIKQHVPPKHTAPLARRAVGGLVSPLKDGLNLVAFELMAIWDRENPGVLGLSEGAGGHDYLSGACVTLDPYDLDQMADSYEKMLTLPLGKRKRLHRTAMKVINEHPLHRWSGYLSDLAEAKYQRQQLTRFPNLG